MSEDRALATIDGQIVPTAPKVGIIRPLATPDEALDAWREFEALKAKLVTGEDVQHIQGKDFLKKSGFRKLATAFGLSVERMAEEREDLKPAGFLWRITVRATATNGRHFDGVAACASTERKMAHPEHDTYSTAYTRAANRAIGDLIGGGLVSAEEVQAASKPTLTPDAAANMLRQFELSCAQQHLDWAWFELATELMCNGGDLRRAFKTLKTASEHQGQEVDAAEVEAGEEEAPADE